MCPQNPTKTWTLLYCEKSKSRHHLPQAAQHTSFAESWSGCWLWAVECWSTPLPCRAAGIQSRAPQTCSLVQSACWPCNNWSQTILEAMVEVRGGCAYSCPMAVRQVGCPAKWSEMSLEMTYNKETNVQSMASSWGHPCRQHGNCSNVCGLGLPDQTAHFRVAFHCGQLTCANGQVLTNTDLDRFMDNIWEK